MSESIAARLDRIEGLLVQINSRIENFLGYEELTADEKEELEAIRAFDAAKASGDQTIPFKQAMAEIEQARQ